MSTQEPERPWYKEGYLWLVIALPAIVVVAAIATLFIAMDGENSLVNDDYYKAGLAINAEFERDERAVELGIVATIDTQNDQLWQMTLAGDWSGELLNLRVSHPTLASRDQIAVLSNVGGNEYIAEINAVAKGRWAIEISPPDRQWRLRRTVALPADSIVLK